MKKKLINEHIKFELNWTCGVSLEQIKKDVEELEKLGATQVDITLDYDTIKIDAYKERKETEKEFRERIRNEKEHAEYIEKLQRAEYEKLKSKFEKL